jgi:HK97 gp10 family phage protein
MARVYLKGLPQLKAKLIRLKTETAKDIAPAMAAAGDKVVEMMKRLAPVDEGKLRDSIAWTFGDAPKGAIKVATVKEGILRLTIYAGNEDVFWARFVEFGTAPHVQGGEFAGTEHPGNPAQPFFFPSYRALKKEIKSMVRKAIREAVRKAVR